MHCLLVHYPLVHCPLVLAHASIPQGGVREQEIPSGPGAISAASSWAGPVRVTCFNKWAGRAAAKRREPSTPSPPPRIGEIATRALTSGPPGRYCPSTLTVVIGRSALVGRR